MCVDDVVVGGGVLRIGDERESCPEGERHPPTPPTARRDIIRHNIDTT